MTQQRKLAGAMAYHAGLAAEESVASSYERSGLPIIARRWRGAGGEVDLIARDGKGYVFIEVKQSRSHAQAAQSVTPRQIARIFDTAMEYVSGTVQGLAAEMRFDVALVDGTGRVQILKNALAG